MSFIIEFSLVENVPEASTVDKNQLISHSAAPPKQRILLFSGFVSFQ
jgi:hypothetical protein